MDPVDESGREQIFVRTDDVQIESAMADRMFGSEPMSQAHARVQRDGLPNGSHPGFGEPELAEEARGRVCSFDLKPLVAASVCGEAEVVHESGEEDDFFVVVDPGTQSMDGREFTTEQIAPHAVIVKEVR
ncbi:hypothetical protein MMAGJ_49400 [Mycolicibacterium mageritense]|uniref:Uncharacterized protein n=1 Tax=Mycolicibacterium mageritense TaxID=53462 RepID=A0ABM7HYG6_MYCME|nr:hypothetical protein MMAGJ_49400 [Mycolicibacterium mageritense]